VYACEVGELFLGETRPPADDQEVLGKAACEFRGDTGSPPSDGFQGGEVQASPRRGEEAPLAVHEPGTNQFADGSLCGVLGIASLGVGVEDKDQLVHREPGRVFVEERRQDGALRSLVCICG
jgi:hypothetical protein